MPGALHLRRRQTSSMHIGSRSQAANTWEAGGPLIPVRA